MSDLGVAYVKFAQTHPALYQVMYDRARAEDAMPQKEASDHDQDAFQIVKDALTEVGGKHHFQRNRYPPGGHRLLRARLMAAPRK